MRRFLKFCVVGASGVVVNEGLLFVLTEYVGLFYILSSIIGMEIAIITNFILNDSWTFRDKNNGTFFSRLLRWNSARFLTVLVNLFVLWALTTLGMHYLISNLFGIALATGLAYAMSSKWVWK